MIGKNGTMFGIEYTKGFKGIGKTRWTKLTSCVEEEKKGVSSKNVDTYRHAIVSNVREITSIPFLKTRIS